MAATDKDWERIMDFFRQRFTAGETPTPETILYLTGVRELGEGPRRYSKDEKINLMHVGLCTILTHTGHCRRTGTGKDGWPLFAQEKSLPASDRERETIIREGLIRYFRENGLLD